MPQASPPSLEGADPGEVEGTHPGKKVDPFGPRMACSGEAGQGGGRKRTVGEEADLRLEPIRLSEKLSRISEYWSPRVVGELNGQHVKLAKLKGAFLWHHHQNEDELFLVLGGTLELELRDGTVILGPGEMYIVPRGVEHRPVAREEVHLLLFEPASTLNTGNVENERTVRNPEPI